MSQIRRLRNDSNFAAVQSVAEPENTPLPEGVILRGEEEMIIWRQFTRTRAARDWRDFDLILVAKMVRAESDMRKHQLMLDRAGPLLKTDKGMPIANPLIAIIDSLQRQQLALIRTMSLAQTESDPRTKNAAGVQAQNFRNLFNGADDLIARPN